MEGDEGDVGGGVRGRWLGGGRERERGGGRGRGMRKKDEVEQENEGKKLLILYIEKKCNSQVKWREERNCFKTKISFPFTHLVDSFIFEKNVTK